MCNETLAYLNIRNKLGQHLNHRDPSLPSKISKFELECNQRGLWATDPPKTLSDIVESVFGAAHVDGGFIGGQDAVRNAMKPILSALTASLSYENENDMKDKAHSMMHPKQFVHEMAGGTYIFDTYRTLSIIFSVFKCFNIFTVMPKNVKKV